VTWLDTRLSDVRFPPYSRMRPKRPIPVAGHFLCGARDSIDFEPLPLPSSRFDSVEGARQVSPEG